MAITKAMQQVAEDRRMRGASIRTKETSSANADPRLKRGVQYADSETTWYIVPSFQYYAISKDAKIFDRTRGRIIKQSMGSGSDERRYLTVHLKDNGEWKTVGVHVLMAETFLGPNPGGAWVLHKDDVSTNNHPDNLYYGDPTENYRDAMSNCRRRTARTMCDPTYRTLVSRRQEQAVKKNRPLIPVAAIKDASGLTWSDLANLFGVSNALLYKCRVGIPSSIQTYNRIMSICKQNKWIDK